MAVRSVTSSPGASLERRFKGRGTWGEGQRTKNNHCSLTLFLTLTLLKEGRGARDEGRGKACCEKQSVLTHPVSHTHTTEGGTRDEGRDRGKGSNCEEQPLLTHPVSYTHTTEGGARDVGRDRGKGSNCEEQSLLTHPVSHTTQGGARNEGRDRGKAARGEGRDRGKGSNCEEQPLLTHPVSYTHTTEGGARDVGRDRGKAARCEKKSLLTHPVSYTHTTEGAARNEARGTRNEQLFTVYCSLQRNIPMLLPRQLHRFGFEHPEGADQF